MKHWAWGIAAILLLGTLATAIVFAVWASAGDAPWEKATACVACEVCPVQTHEQLAEIACLQGGGEWLGYTDERPCWHSLPYNPLAR
jgi:hypothetical protein